MKRKSIKKQLTKFKDDASKCQICREAGLLYKHENGKWAYPLFDKNLECRSGVLAIAEAPNEKDTFDPKKSYLSYDIETDPTGNFFRELLHSVNLTVHDVIITNSVLCLPAAKNGKYPVSSRQISMCSTWVSRLISEVNPEVVLTLGGKALEAIKKIDRHSLTLSSGAGKMHSWYGRKLLPLYHPSLRGRANRKADLQKKDISVLKKYLQIS
ncbi:MAG: uracil-DNA glycosylase family protein [bacterium]|nr:uracil-DNA glycosylase family protein [bacterium]